METIKIDNSYFNQIQRELDLEDIADLEIDLHWISEEIARAKGPRAKGFWTNRLKETEAQIAEIKAQM